MAPTWRASSSSMRDVPPAGGVKAGTTKGTRGSPFFGSWRGRPGAASGSGARRGGLGLRHAVALDALRADADPLRGAVHLHPHRLEVRIPAAVGAVVGVAHVVAGRRPLGAECADPCHMSRPSKKRPEVRGGDPGAFDRVPRKPGNLNHAPLMTQRRAGPADA